MIQKIQGLPNEEARTVGVNIKEINSESKDNENQLITADFLYNLEVDEIFLLFGLFPVGISLLVGGSDVGKSMFLHELAMRCVSGQDHLGHQFNGKHKSAIYVCTEDDPEAVAFRLRRQNKTICAALEDLSRLRYIFDSSEIPEKLEEALQDNPADLVICDALGDLFNGKDLNQNNQVRQFLNRFSQIATKYKIPIVFLHHTSKRSEDLAPSKNNSIGSQGIEAKARFVAELRQSRTDNNIRHFCIVKGNYLSREEKTASFDLLFDENFCFHDTGKRTDFESLAADFQKQKKKEQQHSDEEFIGFLQGLYPTKDTFYTSRVLAERVMLRFSVSDRTARNFILLFEGKQWIKNKSKAKSRKEYILLRDNLNPLFD